MDVIYGFMKMDELITRVLGGFKFVSVRGVPRIDKNDLRPTDMTGNLSFTGYKLPHEISLTDFMNASYAWNVMTEKYGAVGIMPFHIELKGVVLFSGPELDHIIDKKFPATVVNTVITMKRRFDASIQLPSTVPKKDPPKKSFRVVKEAHGPT